MPRLSIDAFALRFPRTGVATYTFNIIAELLKRSQFDVTALLGDYNFVDAEIATFVAEKLKTRIVDHVAPQGWLEGKIFAARNRDLAARLPRPVEVRRVVPPGDIYHSTDWYYYAAPQARYNIMTYHDLTAQLYPKFHERTNIVKEQRKAKAVKEFDHIVAVSQSTKNDLVNLLGVSEEKITTCHVGVDRRYEARNYVDRDVFLKKFDIDPNSRYILSVSTIEPRKNTIGILDTFKALRDAYPAHRDIKLVLTGHMGWRNEGLKKYLDSYPHLDHVIFTGFVASDDMPSLYHHADAFIYLSFYEGFGLPILEAMKSSCPVVCSNTSSMPEVIGDCGETVSPRSPDEAAAALARILDDRTYADALRFSALVRSEGFTWANHVTQLVKIYENA